MTKITTLFWDVGGVLLTNGWDRQARREAAERFHIDGKEFQQRHQEVVSDFEAGHLTLEAYLDFTVFDRPHSFSRAAFKEFMYSRSQPDHEMLHIAQRLARSRRFLMAALNNESAELNLYRIERFGLRQIFALFFSSCYLKVAKPDPAIYRLALAVIQRRPEECFFTDDREPNVAEARRLGMQAVRFESAQQLRQVFEQLDVKAEGESTPPVI